MCPASVYVRFGDDARKREAGRDWKELSADVVFRLLHVARKPAKLRGHEAQRQQALQALKEIEECMAAGSWAGWFSETAQAASTWSCWAPSRGVAKVGYQRCNCMVCLGEQNRSRHCVGGGSLGTGPPTWRQICALVLSFLLSWSSLESATRQDVDFETCYTFAPDG